MMVGCLQGEEGDGEAKTGVQGHCGGWDTAMKPLFD